MDKYTTLTDEIRAFDHREKFLAEEWDHRSLHTSPVLFCETMSMQFHICCNELIQAINEDASEKRLKSILYKSISSFKRREYDTDEGECICALFYELAAILRIDFDDQLSNWLYGRVSTSINKVFRQLFPPKQLERIVQRCTNCEKELTTLIKSREQNDLKHCWVAGKCQHCAELNLVVLPGNVKEFKSANYRCIENFHNHDYTYHEALLRMEQIKYFRQLD